MKGINKYFGLFLLGTPFVLSNYTHACQELQNELLDLSNSGGGTYVLPSSNNVVCETQTVAYKNVFSNHGLLVPEDVVLDLNENSLILDLEGGNTYGVRLASHSAIKNGTVKVKEKTKITAGDQGIWHSAISVGAGYSDGGLAENPSYFTEVGYWEISGVTVGQPHARSAIQIMSEAHHGLIRDVTILDSEKATKGIGLDWGSVGSFSADDDLMPSMRKLWEKGLVYTTHPHDIIIEDVTIGKLSKTDREDGKDSDDYAGIRTSATHNITIRDVTIGEAAVGFALRAGDVGYEFAKHGVRDNAHKNMRVEDFKIKKARRKGVFVDGIADNVYRAIEDYAYDAMHNPMYPGIDQPLIRFGIIRGQFIGNSGVHIRYANSVEVEDVNSEEFEIGVHIANGVYNSTIWRSDISNNSNYGVYINGASQTPDNILISDNDIYNNTSLLQNQIYQVNGTNITINNNRFEPTNP